MLKFEFSMEEINTILSVLHEAPYKIAEPLIAKIRIQAAPQVHPPKPPDAKPDA